MFVVGLTIGLVIDKAVSLAIDKAILIRKEIAVSFSELFCDKH